MKKTNVMRMLDKQAVKYTALSYTVDDSLIDGVSVAKKIGLPVEQVFKTLVCHNTNKYYVFIIPVMAKLDLKKAAIACHEKSVAMLHQKDLLPLTGYVHGGCSPIGMKKPFPTYLDESAQSLAQIAVSAGQIGAQVLLDPQDLLRVVGASLAPLC